jgi:hypothetical protein
MMKGKDKVKQVLDAMHEVVVAWGKSSLVPRQIVDAAPLAGPASTKHHPRPIRGGDNIPLPDLGDDFAPDTIFYPSLRKRAGRVSVACIRRGAYSDYVWLVLSKYTAHPSF